MKKIVLLLVFAVASVGAFAQIDAKSVRLGGQAGVSSSKIEPTDVKQTSVFINPAIGYAFSTRLVADLLFNISSSMVNNGGTDLKTSAFGIGLQAKYYFTMIKAMQLFVITQMLHSTINRDLFNGGQATDKLLQIAIGPGVEYFILPFFSIHTQIGVSLAILSDDNSDYKQTDINLDVLNAGELVGNFGFTFWF